MTRLPSICVARATKISKCNRNSCPRDGFEKADRAGFECSAKPPYAVEKFCAIFIVFFALFWWYNRDRI